MGNSRKIKPDLLVLANEENIWNDWAGYIKNVYFTGFIFSVWKVIEMDYLALWCKIFSL